MASKNEDVFAADFPVTPDLRYIVVRDRLWRRANPGLPDDKRKQLIAALMKARRQIGAAIRLGDRAAESEARMQVNAAKIALGERGKPWWNPEEGDFNQRLVSNTPYASWYRSLKRTKH